MGKMEELVLSMPRPLPVIVLADISGSMIADGKIEALNSSVAEMIRDFAEQEDARAEIHIAVITFGVEGAKLHKPLTSASDTAWQPMSAAGQTPMGAAINLAREMLEDRDIISGRAYAPTLVLVSDGEPTDDWEGPLDTLKKSERASKAIRMAMGIGEDADKGMLKEFIGNERMKVFEAYEAREIKHFFRWVTMSVTRRSHSLNPDSEVIIEPPDFNDFEF